MKIPNLPMIAFSLSAASHKMAAIIWPAVSDAFLFRVRSHTYTMTSTDRFLTRVFVSVVLSTTDYIRDANESSTASDPGTLSKKERTTSTAMR